MTPSFLPIIQTKLISGIDQDNPAIIAKAIEKGADANFVFCGRTNEILNNSTPVIYAVRTFKDTALSCLISEKADLEAAGGTGLPPIIHAVLENNRPAFDVLIEAGAHIDALSVEGYTAYHLACRIGESCDERKKMAYCLKRCGANTALQPPKNFTVPPSVTPFASPAWRKMEWLRRSGLSQSIQQSTPR